MNPHQPIFGTSVRKNRTKCSNFKHRDVSITTKAEASFHDKSEYSLEVSKKKALSALFMRLPCLVKELRYG